MKIEPGAQVTPNVRLVRRLGEGGMGEVWVAEHTALGTEVAVKFLLGDYAQDPAARSRFSQEAAAASQVKSAHVVKVHDYGITDSDVPFIVMEMLEGTDLARRLELEKKIPPADMLEIVRQLCKALERAHERGVIHRDIKPENVFLTNEGGDLFVKLLDFGIAKTETVLRKTTGNRRSTMAGESLGTPYYMSPEQFRSAKSIDARSDLWAVGVLVYEALTGVLPFVAETVSALAILVNECKAPPPTSVDPSLPAALDAWFAKACAREPNDRFQTARELSSALRVALGAAPEASDASTSGARRVVISQVDAAEAARLSFRDTTFATAGGEQATRKRAATPIIATLVVLAAVAGTGVWLAQSHRAAQPPASQPLPTDTPSPTATATATATAPATATVAATVTATATAAVTATASFPRAVPSHHASVQPSATAPATSASAKPKERHGDIW